LCLKQQRFVGLHAHHELHAAVEVEPEFEGLPYWMNHPQRKCDDADDDEHTVASARAERIIRAHTFPPVHTKTHL
jgi:hypothetical protein